MIKDCEIDDSAIIYQEPLVNLYGCKIGAGTKIGAFVEIGPGVVIGNNCSIGAFSFIPAGVTVGDNVFIGPRVTFCNDTFPKANKEEWVPEKIIVENDVVIGASVTILPGVILEKGCFVGAGARVLKTVIKNSKYREKLKIVTCGQ